VKVPHQIKSKEDSFTPKKEEDSLTKFFFIKDIGSMARISSIRRKMSLEKNNRVSRWSPPVPEIIKINILMMFCRSEGGQLVLLLVIMKALSGNMASVG